VNRWTNEWTN